MSAEPRPERTTVLVVEPEPGRWNEVAAAANSVVRLVGGTLHDVRDRLATEPGIVVFGPTFADEQHLLEIESLDLQRHGVLAVLVADEVGDALLHQALEAGLRDVVTRAEAGDTLPATILRLLPHLDPDGATPPSAPGRLLAFTGAKSGVGTSTLAANVAVELAGRGQRVIVVDADVLFGDLPLILGIRPVAGLADLVGREGRLSPNHLRNLLTPHPVADLRLLAAPRGPEDGLGIGPREVVAALGAAVQLADVVIVDTPAGLGEIALAVLDEADAVVLVTVPSATALHDLGLELGVLERLHLRAKSQLVVNRAVPERTPARHRLESSAGVPVAAVVPESSDVIDAESYGRPVVGRRHHRVAGAIRDLADRLVGPVLVRS